MLLQRRIIQAADTADEFYCVMGQLSQEMLDYKVSDSNKLIKVIFPMTQKYPIVITKNNLDHLFSLPILYYYIYFDLDSS